MTLLLTDLTETLVQYLNDGAAEWNTEGETFIEAKFELDPLLMLLPELSVFVVPVNVDFSIEGSNRRRRLTSIPKILNVKLIVARVFKGLPMAGTVGISNWADSKAILDTRQLAEEYLLTFHDPRLQIVSIEPQELEEEELEHRNFVAQTFFSYEEIICVS